jgi:WD40 repeat protein
MKSIWHLLPSWKRRRGSNRFSEDDDLRYPRPQWVVNVRRILSPWWLVFIWYFFNVCFNLLQIVSNNGPQALLKFPTLFNALLLTPLVQLLKSRPWVAILSLAVVVCFIALGLWSYKDQEREKHVLARRKEEEERRLTQQRHDELEKRLSATQVIDSKVKKPTFFLPDNLPDLYIHRPVLVEQLRDALLGGKDRVWLTASVHGMGGLGKTVLARAICDDPAIRSTFRDGILWATAGYNPKPGKKHPRVAEIQSNWIAALDGNVSAASNVTKGKVELQTLLEDRAMLLVLDDVWNQKDIEHLRVGGRQCRILITTRDRAVADTTALIELGIMSVEESRELLKIASKGKLQDDKLVDMIARRLGRLPLALDIVARLLADDIGWPKIEQALSTNIEQIAYGNHTLAAVITSVSFLDATEQKRFHELIVFPQDERIPEGAAARLWRYAGLEAFETSLLLGKLRQRALLQDGNTLHDILYSYLQSVTGVDAQCELHNILINAYGGPNAWPTFPGDDESDDEMYAWRHLGYHLYKAERLPELREMLTDGTYLTAKIKLLGVVEVFPDYTYLPKDERLQLVAGALQLGAQVLSHHLDQFRNQLYGRLGTLSDIHNLPIETQSSLNLDSYTLGRPNAPSLSTFKGHKGSVFSCAFSPNEQQLLSASADTSLRLWNIQTSETIHTFEGHSGSVNDCMFTRDGQMVISASDDTTLRIWNISDGHALKILQEHTGSVKSCALSPNGEIILSASTDLSLRLWHIGEEKSFQILRGHLAGVNCCAFHPNGQLLASGADDNTVRVWNFTTRQTVHVLEGHTARILSCNFSSDGKLLASGSEDKTIRIWEVESGQNTRILEGHTDFVHSCTFSPDGTKILSGSSDYKLRLWNVTTGQTEQILTGHGSWVNKCCFNRNGQRALSASYDNSIRLWSLPDGITIQVFPGDIGYLRDCTFSSDGELVLSAHGDGSLQLWDAHQGVPLRKFRGHSGYASSCAFSPNGDLILSASADASLRLWDFHTGQTLRVLEGHTGHIYHCIFSPDGAFALSASYDKTLRLWDVNTGEVCNIFVGHKDVVRGCSFSPDGKLVLSSSWDNTLRLWDVKSGQTIQLFQGHSNHVRSCTFSPDGKYALSASYDNTLKLWNVEDGQCIRTFKGHTNWVFDCTFTLDGKLFISVADDHELKLWRVETGEEVASWIADAPLTCCDISRDGKRIICGDSLSNLHFLHLENI